MLQPVRITDLVTEHAKRWRLQRLHRLEVIRQKWLEAAGDYVSRHATPVRLVRKVLRVAVEDAAWANELTYLTKSILARLQELLPGKWVEEIKIVQGEPLPPPEPPAQPIVLADASPEMEERANRVSEEVGDSLDGELAEAVRRAMLKGLRRLDAEDKDPCPSKDGEEP